MFFCEGGDHLLSLVDCCKLLLRLRWSTSTKRHLVNMVQGSFATLCPCLPGVLNTRLLISTNFSDTPPPQTAAMETMPRGACQQLHAQPKTFPFPSFPPRNRHSKIFEAYIGQGGSLGQKKEKNTCQQNIDS